MSKFYNQKFLLVIIILGLLIFLHTIKILIPIESFITDILSPPLKNFYHLSSIFRLAYNQETATEDLQSKVIQMGDLVKQLSVENAKLKIVEEENQYLRQQLKFLSKNQYRYVLGNIISRGEITETANNERIIIDKGAKDGLIAGLAVVSPDIYGTSSQGVIIGKVVNIKDSIAEVNLITNQNCKLAVTIFNENKTTGIAHGEFGLTVKMEFIPQTENVKAQEIVITSGLEQNIPRGLVVGKIIEVIKENNALWQNAVIEPLIDLDKPLVVAVLLPL